jgi:hypothetical protein
MARGCSKAYLLDTRTHLGGKQLETSGERQEENYPLVHCRISDLHHFTLHGRSVVVSLIHRQTVKGVVSAIDVSS